MKNQTTNLMLAGAVVALASVVTTKTTDLVTKATPALKNDAGKQQTAQAGGCTCPYCMAIKQTQEG